MIEVRIIDNNEQTLISLNSVQEINSFFKSNFSENLAEITMGLISEHLRIDYNEITFHFSNQNIDNIAGVSIITYKPL
jgi:hypothetical protein